MKNERDYIEMKSKEQKIEKDFKMDRQAKVDAKFRTLADKERLHSVGIFLPSKLNI